MCSVASVVLPLWSQSPPKVDIASEPAVEALRGTVRAIKQCPKVTHAEFRWGKGATEICRTLVGPPQNVTWDVTPSNSVRAPYVGYVELTTPWISLFLPTRSASSHASIRAGLRESTHRSRGSGGMNLILAPTVLNSLRSFIVTTSRLNGSQVQPPIVGEKRPRKVRRSQPARITNFVPASKYACQPETRLCG